MAKATYDVNENFLAYQEEIVTSPAYAGMPDLRYEDGSIQWEAPSNRSGGQFRDSHDKRLQWWKEKAESIGIDTNENQWISKTAKSIHPTKVRPCKVCGRYMDIRYCYFSKNLIKRIQKLTYFRGDIEINGLISIFDFVPQFIGIYGESAMHDLPKLLSCKRISSIPTLSTIEEWQSWLEAEYIAVEPSLLSPGAMSNAPDRLDGFHYNRCCRATTDTGRTKENLALYSTDRRAFEHWVDGNWVAANKLMGLINSDPHIKVQHCLHNENHPLPCSADHIGPISLGFAHRPEFQLLCKPCNSAKNNRMYYSDIVNLRRAEKAGEEITSWYSTDIWRYINPRVVDTDSALQLCRIFRDNRYNAMMMLAEYMKAGHYLFLYMFLNLEHADFSYKIKDFKVENHIVTATFEQIRSDLKYVLIQKARRVRVAFSSLADYSAKENRNGLRIDLKENKVLFAKSLAALKDTDAEYKRLDYELSVAWNSSEEKLSRLIASIFNFRDNKQVAIARDCFLQIMNNIAVHLAEKWDDPRYSRDLVE